jgi:hypothetical protein
VILRIGLIVEEGRFDGDVDVAGRAFVHRQSIGGDSGGSKTAARRLSM